MADLLKPAFRATSGLDAAGEKVINVAKADYDTLTDGVNVEFFIEENTLQQYDVTRGYDKDFAVIYDNRIWVSLQPIAEPAGPFTEAYWKAVRTDPKWAAITTPVHQLRSGEYVTIDSGQRACTLSLPATPQDGDTIVVKDIGNDAGYKEQKIRATNQLIVRHGAAVQETLLTKPFSYNIIIFANRQWQFYETANEEVAKRVVSSASTTPFKSQAGDLIVRRYTSANPVRLGLPKYANDGDMVRSVDIDGMGPTYHLIVSTFDATTSIGAIGTTSMEFRTTGSGFFVYNAADRVWKIFDGDIKTRIRVIRDDVKLLPNESIMVFGENNSTPQTINVELPTGVADGDIIKVALNYIRKMQTVVIKVANGTTDKIASDIKLLQFPKRSEYPPDTEWVLVNSLTFNGDISYTPVIEFSYVEDKTTNTNYWVIAQNVPTVERVDPKDNNTRKRLGVISLASQVEANVDHENNPAKEQAITPETLANRVATETRRGIARIATTQQVNQNTDFAFQDDLIISPKKLNERTATETRRGVAEIATQLETNAGTDDTVIITPKKLEARRATETMAGIAALVKSPSAPGVNRTTAGTNVYNNADHINIVTPKALFDAKSTYTAQGGVYLATETEVIAGTQHTPEFPTVVTPVELHKKTATETRIGFSEIATQVETDAGTDDFRFITPLKLNNRKASDTLTGIARFATQVEFDLGESKILLANPLTIKTRFNDTARTSVAAESGLVETGTLWDHYTLDIREASEAQRGTLKLSTQLQVDTGTDDKTAVTPLKLQKKKATESTEGIIQLATLPEIVAGVIDNKAFSPKHYKYVVQQEKSWEATPLRRGYVKLTEGALTWAGDDVQGSVANQETFEKTGYAVSPYELNTTLSHYLPISAKAVDSDKLDGIDSLQFVRRDIDQTVEGALTLTKQTTVQAPIVSTSTAKFAGNVEAGDILTKGPISIVNGTNKWNLNAPVDGKVLTFGDTTNVLTLSTETGDAQVQNDVKAGRTVEAKTSFKLNGSTVIENTGSLIVGDTSDLVLKAKDAGNILARDDADYKVLTEKNVVEIVDRTFVKKSGDTMGGKLTIEAPVLPRITEQQAVSPLTAANIGFWGAEIKTPAIYETLPGYAVPIMEMKDGVSTGFVERYEYIKAPGLMTCAGTSIDYITRTWSPRPEAAQENHAANTQWISIWDVARSKWGDWGRVYTNEAPPTANEIGAVSSSGSAFNNLTIRDWLQIGNVRIEPDQATRTVKFTWIDIP